MEQDELPDADRRTIVERVSEREMRTTRLFDAAPELVYAAWTRSDLMMRWWVPKSVGISLSSCRIDARTGGTYRFEFALPDGGSMAFFGRYLEAVPGSRLVWTNEESPDGSITTVTFEAVGARTKLVMSEVYPSAEALEQALRDMDGAAAEQFGQLDTLLADLADTGSPA